jgi:hypothetical protein
MNTNLSPLPLAPPIALMLESNFGSVENWTESVAALVEAHAATDGELRLDFDPLTGVPRGAGQYRRRGLEDAGAAHVEQQRAGRVDPGAVAAWAGALPSDRPVLVYCVCGHAAGDVSRRGLQSRHRCDEPDPCRLRTHLPRCPIRATGSRPMT